MCFSDSREHLTRCALLSGVHFRYLFPQIVLIILHHLPYLLLHFLEIFARVGVADSFPLHRVEHRDGQVQRLHTRLNALVDVVEIISDGLTGNNLRKVVFIALLLQQRFRQFYHIFKLPQRLVVRDFELHVFDCAQRRRDGLEMLQQTPRLSAVLNDPVFRLDAGANDDDDGVCEHSVVSRVLFFSGELTRGGTGTDGTARRGVDCRENQNSREWGCPDEARPPA